METMYTIYSFEHVASTLMPDKDCEPFRIAWEDSQACYIKSDIFFLKDAYLEEVNKVIQLPEPALSEFKYVIPVIRDCPELSRLVWHCYYLLFCKTDYPTDLIGNWPVPEKHLGSRAWMFPAVVALSGLSRMFCIHKSANIPTDITKGTAFYLYTAMKYFYDRNGSWGLVFLGWITNHLAGRIYLLDRLFFMMAPFPLDLKVLRNKNTGRVVTLAEKGRKYRRDGLVDGANGYFDKMGAWEAQYYETQNTYIGNPLMPNGHVLNETRQFLKSEWEIVLSKGDPMLDVHVPGIVKLLDTQCMDAYKYAMEFFPKHFPNFAFKGFMCWSWLFDPQFQLLLPPEANIVQFQKRYHLYCVNNDDEGTFDSVFPGVRPEQADKAPRNTSLQRAILDNMKAGWRFNGALGYFLNEDIKS